VKPDALLCNLLQLFFTFQNKFDKESVEFNAVDHSSDQQILTGY
jgi:hypothetical protein